MFHAPVNTRRDVLDVPALLEMLTHFSSRPKYAFLVLNLIAQVAKPDGSAGPTILVDGASVAMRDWLCDALTPLGKRDPRRIAMEARIRAELERLGHLPVGTDEAQSVIDEEIRTRLRSSGKTNVSRAVSELVKAGLLTRHYQGYRVDHHNRGGHRHAVYTLARPVRGLMRTSHPDRHPDKPVQPVQGELLLN